MKESRSTRLFREEREVADEMTRRYPMKTENINGKFYNIFTFDNFEIWTQGENGGPTKLIELRVSGRTFNFLTLLPEGYTIEASLYPSGTCSYKRKNIRAPMLATRGAILGTLHEISHARRYSTLSVEENAQLSEAHADINSQSETDEQLIILQEDEQLAWEGAKTFLSQIENELKIKIITNEKQMADYISRRLKTYS
jgi:hypothetical protein